MSPASYRAAPPRVGERNVTRRGRPPKSGSADVARPPWLDESARPAPSAVPDRTVSPSGAGPRRPGRTGLVAVLAAAPRTLAGRGPGCGVGVPSLATSSTASAVAAPSVGAGSPVRRRRWSRPPSSASARGRRRSPRVRVVPMPTLSPYETRTNAQDRVAGVGELAGRVDRLHVHQPAGRPAASAGCRRSRGGVAARLQRQQRLGDVGVGAISLAMLPGPGVFSLGSWSTLIRP